MLENNIKILYVPINSKEEAIKLASKLIELKAAACVNVIQGAASIYESNGEIIQGVEYVMWIKTTPEQLSYATNLIKENHPYDTPCILELEAISQNPEYTKWLKSKAFA